MVNYFEQLFESDSQDVKTLPEKPVVTEPSSKNYFEQLFESTEPVPKVETEPVLEPVPKVETEVKTKVETEVKIDEDQTLIDKIIEFFKSSQPKEKH